MLVSPPQAGIVSRYDQVTAKATTDFKGSLFSFGTLMAKLTAKARSKIPTSKFAGPGRSFPIEDKAHARAAIMLSGNAPNPGEVKARARAILKRGKGLLG